MPRLDIHLNGRSYSVNCESGQESRVRELGAYIDKQLREIAVSAPGGSDAHHLMLTALVLADKVFDLNAEVSTARAQVAAAQAAAADAKAAAQQAAALAPPPGTTVAQQTESPSAHDQQNAAMLDAVDAFAKRIETIAARLEGA